MKNQWKLIVMLTVFAASLVLSAFPMAQVAQAKGGGGTKITLVGSTDYPRVKGTAKYKAASESELQIEVQRAKALAGKTLDVFVDGNNVGSFVVNNLGAGSLNINTGRGDTVPLIQPGSTVQIMFGSTLVVSGAF